MKNRKLTSIVCGGALSLAASSVLAQTSSSSPTSTDPNASSTAPQYRSQSPSAAQPGSRLGASASMHAAENVRLSELMNSAVQSQEGKTLGYIRDFTVDPKSGRIEFAILSLSSGGVSDTSTSGRETVPSSRSSTSGAQSSSTLPSSATTSGKLVPVPWQLFSQSWSSSHMGATSSTALGGSHKLVLNIDESKLRSAPSFDASNWSEIQSANFDQRVYSYYGVDRNWATGTSGSSISGQGRSTLDQNYNPSRPQSESRQGTPENRTPETSPR